MAKTSNFNVNRAATAALIAAPALATVAVAAWDTPCTAIYLLQPHFSSPLSKNH